MVTSQHEGLTKVATFEPDHTRHMLLALFDLPIPKSGEGRVASPDLSEADPAVCRADGALLYGDGDDKFGIIVETQRGVDKEKPYSWLEYIANFRSREKCPVCLIVICPKRNVARWALRVIETGHPGLELTPLVIHAGNTPVITDVARARENIGLAVMSAVIQSEDPRFNAVISAVEKALDYLDPKIAERYARHITVSLEGDAQKEWEKRMKAMTYPYMGEYAESLIAKGEVKGEANAIFLILEGRGIPVSDEVRGQVLACSDKDTLEAWLLRALTIETAEALFD
ncbi:hypothetical protein Nocox_09045 [Nonomuraea coxensis DSM 45129]|uniref:DUF4365 domain-containing protein n=1 Tax=Nonomuraea coxensis DSM 45129 TaxID=1122611 RepID=A0ABX8TYI3_9ACTN|nr:hypothetical protein [Nonomuraea coxensis]QYC39433.1 hypothetical protein Nocox_09045 [Nonomuraea coxensis DSM 45129]